MSWYAEFCSLACCIVLKAPISTQIPPANKSLLNQFDFAHANQPFEEKKGDREKTDTSLIWPKQYENTYITVGNELVMIISNCDDDNWNLKTG